MFGYKKHYSTFITAHREFDTKVHALKRTAAFENKKQGHSTRT